MIKRVGGVLALIILSAILSCVHDGYCNNVPQRPSPSPSPTPTPFAYQRAGWAEPTPSDQPSIKIFKNTGELQCGAGKGTSITEMEAALKKNKIPVYESKTQADGMMHMTLCGAPAGRIHLFTIPAAMQKKAEKLGFKTWKDHGEH